MTITALLELTFKADSTADAPRILTKTLEATRSFAGNQGVEVLYDVEDPAHVVVIEQSRPYCAPGSGGYRAPSRLLRVQAAEPDAIWEATWSRR